MSGSRSTLRLSRRVLLKGGAAGAALASGPLLARDGSALTIYDSRLAASRNFARHRRGGHIDLAAQDARFWRDLRGFLPRGAVEGLTGWSDWVIVRGLLEEQGKRVRLEHVSQGLIRWRMA